MVHLKGFVYAKLLNTLNHTTKRVKGSDHFCNTSFWLICTVTCNIREHRKNNNAVYKIYVNADLYVQFPVISSLCVHGVPPVKPGLCSHLCRDMILGGFISMRVH